MSVYDDMLVELANDETMVRALLEVKQFSLTGILEDGFTRDYSNKFQVERGGFHSPDITARWICEVAAMRWLAEHQYRC